MNSFVVTGLVLSTCSFIHYSRYLIICFFAKVDPSVMSTSTWLVACCCVVVVPVVRHVKRHFIKLVCVCCPFLNLKFCRNFYHSHAEYKVFIDFCTYMYCLTLISIPVMSKSNTHHQWHVNHSSSLPGISVFSKRVITSTVVFYRTWVYQMQPRNSQNWHFLWEKMSTTIAKLPKSEFAHL